MKKRLLLGLLTIISCFLFAQEGGWERVISSEDNLVINGKAVYQAPSGDLLAAYTVAEGGAVNYDSSSIALAWFDTEGQILSQHDIPNDGFFLRTAVEILPAGDGNLYLIGTQREIREEEPGPDNELQLLILKVSPAGQIIWSVSYDDLTYFVKRAFLSEDNEIILTGHTQGELAEDPTRPFFMKVAADGSLLDFNHFEENTQSIRVDDATRFGSEYLIVSASDVNNDLLLYKVNLEGDTLQRESFNFPGLGYFFGPRKVQASNDGGCLIVSTCVDNTSGSSTLVIDKCLKFSSELTVAWDYDVHETVLASGGSFHNDAVCLLPNGNFSVITSANYNYEDDDEYTDFSIRYFTEITPDGTIINQQNSNFEIKSETYERILPLSDGGYFAIGNLYLSPPGQATIPASALLLKLDVNGLSLTNQVTGNIRYDENMDCLDDESEIPLAGWFVEATDGNLTYYTQTNETGAYNFELSSGTFTLNAYPPSNLWELCEPSMPIDPLTAYDTISFNFNAQAVTLCPVMWVDLAVPFLRNCAENTYQVNYCNFGTVDEENAFLEILLPPGMSVLEASEPYEILDGGLLSFALGMLEIGACGDLTLKVYVDCEEVELGETLCAEVQIFPDTICSESSLWSGASIDVDGKCIEGDSLRFTIKNIGSAATSVPLGYVIVEDQVIMMHDVFDLPPNDSIVITLESTGGTFRLESEQEPNHPGNSMPSIAIEGCGGLTPGIINLYALDDSDLSVDIDCKEVIASYDPNDKTGFPIGYNEEHFINRNTELEYLIRFQNTGTDTAFRVVLRDTLSEFLEVKSIRPGASSHPYTFNVSESGLLKFTFDNILLPDSTTNLEGSNGFVEFKVQQKVNNPLGTEIFNSAAIYFDFNEPVITNETKHTIGEVILTDIRDVTTSAHVESVNNYPNPFSEETTLKITGQKFQSGSILIYSSDGQLLREQFFTSSSFIIKRDQLQTGIYPFVIKLDGIARYSGKLMVLH